MANTALLVIDIQQGAFDGERIEPIDAADQLIGNARQLIGAARRGGVPVIFVQHLENTPGEPFEEGSAQAEVYGALGRDASEPVVQKRASNAFDGTDLGQQLEALGARELVLCGLQSEHCISNTTKGALEAGYRVTIAEDGHSTWPWDGESAVQIKARVNANLAALGATMRKSGDLIAPLAAGHL